MIKLRVSRRGLRIAGWSVLVLVLLAGLYCLGGRVTPLSADGRPLILSPSLRATEQYRARARDWVSRMVEIDERLTALLAMDEEAGSMELYKRVQEMEALGEETTRLVEEIRGSEVTVAMVGLREHLDMTATAYLDAALATARWLNTPSEAGRQEASEALDLARTRRIELGENQWLSVKKNTKR